MSHSPGPWSYRMAFWIDGAQGRPIADVRDIGDCSEANARLLAAAPQLLEALRALVISGRLAMRYRESSALRDRYIDDETNAIAAILAAGEVL